MCGRFPFGGRDLRCEQGGPDSTSVKNDPFYNQWEDLDDSPITWDITEVCPLSSAFMRAGRG